MLKIKSQGKEKGVGFQWEKWISMRKVKMKSRFKSLDGFWPVNLSPQVVADKISGTPLNMLLWVSRQKVIYMYYNNKIFNKVSHWLLQIKGKSNFTINLANGRTFKVLCWCVWFYISWEISLFHIYSTKSEYTCLWYDKRFTRNIMK